MKQVKPRITMPPETLAEIAKLAAQMCNQLVWPTNLSSNAEQALTSAYGDLLCDITRAVVQMAPELHRARNNGKTNMTRIMSRLEKVVPQSGVNLTGSYQGTLQKTVQKASSNNASGLNGQRDWSDDLADRLIQKFGRRVK